MPPTGDPGQADRRRTAWRTRYALLGGVTAVVLIVWHFWDGRGDVLKADGGPVVTVMDFGQGFPLDPLPSGWKHRKFWTRTPMTMAFTIKDGVPSMRFETHDSASMLFRHVDIDLAAYPMLAWRWYIELPIRCPLDERTRESPDPRTYWTKRCVWQRRRCRPDRLRRDAGARAALIDRASVDTNLSQPLLDR